MGGEIADFALVGVRAEDDDGDDRIETPTQMRRSVPAAELGLTVADVDDKYSGDTIASPKKGEPKTCKVVTTAEGYWAVLMVWRDERNRMEAATFWRLFPSGTEWDERTVKVEPAATHFRTEVVGDDGVTYVMGPQSESMHVTFEVPADVPAEGDVVAEPQPEPTPEPPPVPEPTPAQVKAAEEEDDRRKLILELRELEEQLQEDEAQLAELEGERKQLKASIETKIERERMLVRRLWAPRKDLPLFDRPAATELPKPAREPEPEPAPEPAQAPVNPDAWMTVSVSDLGLPGKLPTILEEGGIRTLGDLSAWIASDRRTPEVKGVGEKKMEVIEEALAKFWADHPEYTASTPDAQLKLIDGETA